MLTVRSALTMEPLCQGKIVAGAAGLDRPIESLSVLEIPDAQEFLEKNMLALSSFCAIAGDFERQLSTIRLLSRHQASALLVFNVGSPGAMPYLSDELITLCDELNFPIILMPINVSYYSVFKPILNHLLDQQVLKFQNSIEIYEAYMNQLLDSDNAYSSLLDILSKFIQRNIAFFNHNQRCLYATHNASAGAFDPQFFSQIQHNLPQSVESLRNECCCEINETQYLVIPVTQRHSYYGSIVIENFIGPTSDSDRLAITQTCKALCISLFRYERMDKYREKMLNEFLRDLLNGNVGDRSQIIMQSREINVPIEGLSGIMVIRPFRAQDISAEECIKSCRTFYRQANNLFPNSIVIQLEELSQIVVLSTQPNAVEKYLPTAGKAFIAAVDSKCYAPIIGVSPVCTDVTLTHDCYIKALRAMDIAERITGTPGLVMYDSVQIYDVIYESIERSKANRIVEELLKPVQQYDKAYNTELETTFSHLLSSNMATMQVAQDLFLHKNTVLQRKNKIQSLYEENPFSPESHLRFEIGFLLQRLFDL